MPTGPQPGGSAREQRRRGHDVGVIVDIEEGQYDRPVHPQEPRHHDFAFRHEAVRGVEGIGGDPRRAQGPAGARVKGGFRALGADLFGKGEYQVAGTVELGETGRGHQPVDVESFVVIVEIAFDGLARGEHPVEPDRRDHVFPLDRAAAAVAQLDNGPGTRAGERLDGTRIRRGGVRTGAGFGETTALRPSTSSMMSSAARTAASRSRAIRSGLRWTAVIQRRSPSRPAALPNTWARGREAVPEG